MIGQIQFTTLYTPKMGGIYRYFASASRMPTFPNKAGARGNKADFIIGGGQVSAHKRSRLDEIIAQLKNEYSYEIKHHPLKQPPPMPAYEP